MLALPAIPLVRSAEEPAASDAARAEGRAAEALRPLKLRTGVVTSASGSAMIELAHTKVLVSVFGPHATEGREYLDRGQLECSLRFASFARRPRRKERQAAGGTAEERTLSLEMAAALSASVQLHLLPKSTIAVHALVLQDDGGALPAAVSCASLALADASILLYDLVAACSCALVGSEARLDGSAAELAAADGSLSVACMPALDQLTLLRHTGAVAFEQLTGTLQLALSGCALLHREMRAALAHSGGSRADGDAGADAARDDVRDAKRARIDEGATAAE
jgi:exosome complex component MTR3